MLLGYALGMPEMSTTPDLTLEALKRLCERLLSPGCNGIDRNEAAADADARDSSLAAYCERVVQILIAMNAPGCQWLDLAPLAA